MRDLSFIALLLLFAGALVMVPADASVETVGEPIFHVGHVELEILTTERAGVRTTAADGSWIWSQWLAKGQDASLTVKPMGTGNPAELTWHGKTAAGSDRLTFEVAWPADCPCTVELTRGNAVAFTWSGITP